MLVLVAVPAAAQRWLPGAKGGRVHVEQAKEAYDEERASSLARGTADAPNRGKDALREGHNYHFDRWYWHASSHTDSNGYLASPLRTFAEAQRYATAGATDAARTTATDVSNWTFRGPTSSPGGYRGLGRINSVAFHPTDTFTYWVATAGGGAWKTTNGGGTWTSMTSTLPVLGTSDIEFNPLNPQVIYLCTGDRNAGDTYSIGLMKSTDGGLTWGATGLAMPVTDYTLLCDLAINPSDTASLVLATNDGIYRSFDAGNTWTMVQAGSFKQVVYKPGDSSVLYAAGGAQIWRSTDGGATWSQRTSVSNSGRVQIAVTPAAPQVVKAVFADEGDWGLRGVYNSADAGGTFTELMDGGGCFTNILNWDVDPSDPSGNCGGQGWYDLAIAVSPIDPSIVLVGGVNTWLSVDGGLSFNLITQWWGFSTAREEVHADKHYLAYNLLDPTALFECNDGGIYRTYSPASTLWNDLTNGLGITQFYRNAVSDAAPFVLGGAQDNGTKQVAATGSTVAEVGGGDGMNCEIDPIDPDVFYRATQYGNISRTDDGGGNWESISDNIPGDPEGGWITPYKLHPKNPAVVVAGYEETYASVSRGSAWFSIAPPFAGGSKVRHIELAGSDPEIDPTTSWVYVLASATNLRYSPDFGTTWNTIASLGGQVSDIVADPWDSSHLWLAYGGYDTRHVASWTPAGGVVRSDAGLPNVPVHCIVVDRVNGTQYAGTDIGVFFRDTAAGASWASFNNGMPSIEVTDLGINYATGQLWASTYGRGLWHSPKYDPPPVVEEPNAITDLWALPAQVFIVAPNPTAGAFRLSTADSRFYGKAFGMRLIDAAGRTAWTGTSVFNGGGSAAVQANGVAPGGYTLQVSGHGLQAQARVVVLR